MGRKTQEGYHLDGHYGDEYYLENTTTTRWIDVTVGDIPTDESSDNVDGNVS